MLFFYIIPSNATDPRAPFFHFFNLPACLMAPLQNPDDSKFVLCVKQLKFINLPMLFKLALVSRPNPVPRYHVLPNFYSE